jgi:hypothetical protein
MKPGNIGGQRRQPRCADLTGLGIDQKRRADLDDDAAKSFEMQAGHGGQRSIETNAPLSSHESDALKSGMPVRAVFFEAAGL